ncbi:hypothetical protein EGW08_014660 [Elysia chlorotica]|uniref:Serine-threonine kinase receptor-associated protein n=1 Tax=Elysia chlorotica TaxID=188477 RepID=A0A433T7Z7_ELYCH|nr:hypothetical protein EGW08_014660 [Elysia chlorotica]
MVRVDSRWSGSVCHYFHFWEAVIIEVSSAYCAWCGWTFCGFFTPAITVVLRVLRMVWVDFLWVLHSGDYHLCFEKIKEIKAPAPVNTASLHPSKNFFVCGGEDFKMYKFDYYTGEEMESFKGHFGPVHCVRFSPDGELYASGSEDGTLRLWQTTVGTTYGLWNCNQNAILINGASYGLAPGEINIGDLGKDGRGQ